MDGNGTPSARIMDAQDVARWLRVSKRQVYRLVAHGLPHVRLGTRLRFVEEDIRDWMRRGPSS